jgi:hypothetical protein
VHCLQLLYISGVFESPAAVRGRGCKQIERQDSLCAMRTEQQMMKTMGAFADLAVKRSAVQPDR